MTTAERRELFVFLDRVRGMNPPAAEREIDLFKARHTPRKAPKKALPEPLRKDAKAKKDAGKSESKKSTYAILSKRAEGVCEACLRPGTDFNPLQYDHFFGRKKDPDNDPAKGWLIHMSCHHEKTRSYPDAEFWKGMFTAHLRRVGLPIPRELR